MQIRTKAITLMFLILLVSVHGILNLEDNIVKGGITIVGGHIIIDTIWSKANSPYFIEGDIIVDKNVTLTIEPGVEIKFNDYYGLIINGNIKAIGTKNDMIKFSTNKTAPHIRSWKGIEIESDGYSMIENCSITFGEFGIHAEHTSNLTIINNDICFNAAGIFIYYSPYTNINSNNIFLNSVNGILSGFSSLSNITNNNVYLNLWGIAIYGKQHHNKIENNTITSNSIGVSVQDSSHNNTIKNNIIENNDRGIYLEHCYNNIIYYNNIINNTEQAYSERIGNKENIFQMNFWANHLGNDTDNDGIWDEPYFFKINYQDSYPMVKWFLDLGSQLPMNTSFFSISTSTDRFLLYSNEEVNITITVKEGELPGLNIFINLSSNHSGFFSSIESNSDGEYFVTYTAPSVEVHSSVEITATLSKRGFTYGSYPINLEIQPRPKEPSEDKDFQSKYFLIVSIVTTLFIILIIVSLLVIRKMHRKT